jgi:hypothetical protein
MSFEDYRRNIEIVTDPAVVERWKEEARTITSIVTREGEPPTVLPTLAEARSHFRQHYLDGLVRSGTVFRLHGSVARKLPEPSMMQSIREAHERELRYPAQFVQLLRQGLQNAGLHIFKHRKRVVYVSLARPTAFVADGPVSANVLAILDAIAGTPLITRKALAAKVLGGKGEADAPGPATTAEPVAEANSAPLGDGDAVTVAGSEQPPAPAKEDPLAKARAALAADVRFLVQAGHIIEFHNGTFDLPLPPRPKEPEGTADDGQTAPRPQANRASSAPDEAFEAKAGPDAGTRAEIAAPGQTDAAEEAIGLPGVAPAREEPAESERHEPSAE